MTKKNSGAETTQVDRLVRVRSYLHKWMRLLDLNGWVVSVVDTNDLDDEKSGDGLGVCQLTWRYDYLDALMEVNGARVAGYSDDQISRMVCHECVHLFLVPFLAVSPKPRFGLSVPQMEHFVTVLQRKFSELERGDN